MFIASSVERLLQHEIDLTVHCPHVVARNFRDAVSHPVGHANNELLQQIRGLLLLCHGWGPPLGKSFRAATIMAERYHCQRSGNVFLLADRH
ncbi:hypothetical protein NKJ22_13740 [Mesorhizobium sp. M0220]